MIYQWNFEVPLKFTKELCKLALLLSLLNENTLIYNVYIIMYIMAGYA